MRRVNPQEMPMSMSRLFAAATFTAWTALLAAALPIVARAADASVARGQYLVTIAGCGDCHTPGHFLGKPDLARALAGSDVGFEIPGAGVFYGPNLTSDKETGIGNWSREQIVEALRVGTRPDGRRLMPAMPWPGFAHLTDADANAIAAYLMSLPPIKHKVPGPFGPNDRPTSFVTKVVPPDVPNPTK
jgi:mono/diheme cytochrome c family protein